MVSSEEAEAPVRRPWFDAGVVVRAERGELGDLFPTQAGDPTVAADGGQADVVRGDFGAAGPQEVA
jgi:hypothetical protein